MDYEFNLDGAIENLDSVPDDRKHFYAKGNDGYRVDAKFVGAAKRINGLGTNLKADRSKLTEARNEAIKSRTNSKGFDSLVASIADLPEDQRNPDGLKAYLETLVAKAAKGGEKGAEAARQLETVKQEMARAHAIAMGEKDKSMDEMRTSLNRYMIGEQANSALNEHKGNPLFLRPHIDRLTRVQRQEDGSYEVEVLDDKGQIRYNGQGGKMTVPELVETLKKDDRFSAAFEGRVQSGTGTPAGKKVDQRGAERVQQEPPGGKTKGVDMIKRGLEARRAARG